jgi:hypothetical protein
VDRRIGVKDSLGGLMLEDKLLEMATTEPLLALCSEPKWRVLPNQRNPNQLFDLAISNCNNIRVGYICERAGGLHLNCFGFCHCAFKWGDGQTDGGTIDQGNHQSFNQHRSSLATHPPSPGCTGAGH